MHGTEPKARTFSPRAMTLFSFLGAVLIAASSSAVTPLYHLYQETMHLTPFLITVVFAVYVLGLLATLLTIGGLSDYVGRRPLILVALLFNAAAMILFALADNVGQLIVARAVQGLCVGTGTTAFGAAMLDTDRARGPLLNSVTAFIGLAVGAIGSAALITFAPDPLHLVYDVLLGVTVVMIVLLWIMPESAPKKSGAIASLLPRISVPRQSRSVFLRLAPVTLATWGLGGFHLSLMPTVVATAMDVNSPWVGGTVVATLMITGALSVAVFKDVSPWHILLAGMIALCFGVALSLFGIAQHSVAVLFAGTAIAGVGFGTSFSGTLRTLLPTAEPHQRAALLAAFYVMAYLAFSLPAIAAGLSVPVVGLSSVAYLYGAAVILLAVASMAASLWNRAPK